MKKIPEEMFNTLMFRAGQDLSVRTCEPAKTGEGVIDEVTFKTIEVERLFDAVNHAETLMGQATLYRSLVRATDSPDAIRAKQESLRELATNKPLREGLEALIAPIPKLEKDLFHVLFGEFLGFLGNPKSKMDQEGYGYEQYRNGTKMMVNLTADARRLPRPESPYLKSLVETLEGFESSTAHTLMKGPVYLGERGVKTAEEKGKYVPGVKFVPSLFKPGLLLSLVAIVFILAFISPPEIRGFMYDTGPVLMLFLAPMALLYMPIVGTFDREAFIYPLRNRFKASMDLARALEALGQLDELLAFHRYAEAYASPMVLPNILETERHTARLEGAKNPIIGKGRPDYVPNDITLGGVKLTFVTGPNSGGKTAFCKTVAQIQLLAQAGCYVPARGADVSVADRIFYQVPEISSLIDEEGRFGTELKRTKDIFLATSPRSLVILDELSEGTTHEEKMATSANILGGFLRIGNNTILITHNHELVDKYRKKSIGQFRQVEFVGDDPTHRLIDGVSHVSHAERIARKIGFAKEDIDRYLAERGY